MMDRKKERDHEGKERDAYRQKWGGGGAIGDHSLPAALHRSDTQHREALAVHLLYRVRMTRRDPRGPLKLLPLTDPTRSRGRAVSVGLSPRLYHQRGLKAAPLSEVLGPRRKEDLGYPPPPGLFVVQPIEMAPAFNEHAYRDF
ncbi:hypothetical protein JZ751_029449 [Albula glossodonta]|uniref:Uncharacterized protein n=1 Tax=Albula glossodonta TaxID=121402 RepID=A0A8T2PA84_9TELE|nr:hypothetical protein JZ751_029449 [Albula glossodonta]